MCLPLKLLKTIVGIGSIISLALSIGILASVIYINFDRKQIINNANQPIIKDLVVVFYVISIVFLILSLCGLYGSIKAKRKNKLAPCLLSTYFVGVVIFFLIFMTITIIFFAAPSAVFGEDCTKGSKTNLIQSLNKINMQAEQKFCSTTCPCYLEPQNVDSDLANWLKANNKVVGYNTSDSYISYEQCASSTEDKQKSIFLGVIQQTLQCGGWCQSDPFPRFYKFFNLNKCVTKDCFVRNACYDEFKDFTISKGTTLGIAGLIASLFCLINLVFICCICVQTNRRKDSSKNFYARMLEAEN